MSLDCWPVTTLTPTRTEFILEPLVECIIGTKAVGLANLPNDWVPNFFVISSELHKPLRANNTDDKNLVLLKEAVRQELEVLCSGGISHVWVRSSSVGESLEERGRFLSIKSRAEPDDVIDAASSIVRSALADIDSGKIAILVQRAITALLQGHLSNERRLTRNSNQWFWEIEGSTVSSTLSFAVKKVKITKSIGLVAKIRQTYLSHSEK